MPNITSTLTSINRKVSPGNVNQSRDKFGALAEAASNTLSKIKPKELSRRVIIENALYDQTSRYKCPEDLDQKNVMQWFRLRGLRNTDTFYHPMLQTTNRRFDQHQTADRNLFTIEWDKGVKFIKVSDFKENANGTGQVNAGLTISKMDSINDTNNSIWQSFGNATNLITDNLTYIAGSGSLRFSLNSSATIGGLENFNLATFDLTQYMIVGKVFTWLNLPNINQIQTVTLEMFSSAGNGYSITVSSPHDCNSFQEGWNLLGFNLDPSVMTTIGTPNPAMLNHVRFTIVSNGTLVMDEVRFDNIVARKGAVYGIQYISNQIFRDTSGLWKSAPTDGSDEVMLDYEAYQCYLLEASYLIGQEIFTDTGTSKSGMTAGKLGNLSQDLDKNYAWYKKRYKEEFIPEQQEFYRFGVPYGYYGRWGTDGHRFDHGNNGDQG